MPDTSDEESLLVRRAIAGDADAFGVLYTTHMDAIYRYVRFRVGDARDAEDLTEQIFLKAWEALPRYRQRSSPFASWLYRIAHNVVIDHHRRSAPETLVDNLFMSAETLSHGPSALEQVIEAGEIAALSAAIRQLPSEQQQVIVLRFIEGLDHAQVAHIINKSEGACRVIQHRALAALNQLLTGTQHA